MKKIIIITILVAFLYGLIYLFNKTDKSGDIKKVKVAEVTHSAFYTPLYVADALGYFKDQNIELEIILTSGADKVAAAVISKDVQIGLCGSEQTLYVYNNGAKDYLINFAGLTKKDGSFLVSRKNAKFNIKDLNNKTILGGRAGGMPAMTLKYILDKNSINSKVDTSIDFANLSSAFLNGDGDYVALFEPTASLIEKENKGYVIKSVGELGGEVPYTTFNALKSYIEDNKDIIKKFKKAIDLGIEYTKENSSKDIAKIIKDYFPDTSIDELSEIIERYKIIDSWYNNSDITEKGFNHMQDIVEYNGFLKKRVNYNTLVYNLK